MREKKLGRNVIGLGFVSMFNDMASEMVYPIVPLFLTGVLGAPVAVVGIIEGIAEATASTLKVFSGWLSDRFLHRKRFVVAGYTMSATAKLLLAVASGWPLVLGARFVDRFGKGVRTAARDALIADSTGVQSRGAAFGLHRALDTLGAVTGPLIALVLLEVLDKRYSLIFLLAALPAFVGVAILLFVVKEPPHDSLPARLKLNFSLSQFGKPFKIYLLVNVLFGLGNSSDAFLILRSQTLGYGASELVLLYVVFNATYSVLSYPFGRIFDRFGARWVLTVSFFVFAAVYAGFALASHALLLWGLWILYGVYMAMSEGVGKAYISTLIPKESRATALGLFATVTGVVTFLSSVTAGVLWQSVGVPAPFVVGGVLAALAGVVFLSSSNFLGRSLPFHRN